MVISSKSIRPKVTRYNVRESTKLDILRRKAAQIEYFVNQYGNKARDIILMTTYYETLPKSQLSDHPPIILMHQTIPCTAHIERALQEAGLTQRH